MDKTADIIHKYTNDEAKSLQSYGELAGLGNYPISKNRRTERFERAQQCK
jgi:hypothetical protein